MLQTTPARPSAAAPRIEPSATVTLSTLRTVLRRYALLVLLFTALGAGIAALIVWASVPTYVASAQLLIEAQRQQQLLVFEPGMLDLTLDNAQVESQVEVLRSERLAGAVVDALDLALDPEFQGNDETWIAALGEQRPADRATASLAERRRVAASVLAGRVGSRRVGQSYVIETTARSYKSKRAAEIANAYMAAYLQDQYEAKAQAARGGVEWLQLRLREVRQSLNTAARTVEDFRTQNGLVATSNGLLIEQQLSEMNSQFILSRSQTAQAAARLARVREVSAKGITEASVTEVLNNQAITNLRQRQQDAAQREAELRERYGPDSEAVAGAKREVAAAEQDIAAELGRIGQTYLSDYEIAVSRERGLSEEIQRLIGEADRLRQAKVTLSELDAQAQSYRKMYQNLLEKLAETVQKETLPVSGARVIAPANVPLGKSSPKTKLTLTLGTVIGLVFGIAAGTIRHRLDQTARTEADIRRAVPFPVLGLLPDIGRGRSLKGPGEGPDVVEAPFSAFSKAMRGVKVSIDVAREERRIETIGIASIASGDGKSCVALNLACLFAQAGNRTLVVDADFQSNKLSQCLAPTAEDGLLEMLADGREAVRPTAITDLFVLPLVVRSRWAQSNDFLRSKQMHALIKSLAEAYDLIVFDLTAMETAADVRAISRMLDGIVLVAAWGKTELGALAEAATSLDAAQAQVVGVVLNKVGDAEMVSRRI